MLPLPESFVFAISTKKQNLNLEKICSPTRFSHHRSTFFGQFGYFFHKTFSTNRTQISR
jgi:hypothetical protein